MPSPEHTVVIGSGFGGIAAALRARALGHRVTIVEKLGQLGGRAQTFRRGGYTFDAGPTVITAPFLFEELFALFGRRLSDHVELLPVSPWYRYEFVDGSRLDYGPSLEATREGIRRLSPDDVAGYDRLLAASKAIYDVGFTQLADRPFERWTDMARQVPSLLRLGAYRSVWQFTSRFLKDDRLRRAFSIQPLLVGGNPFTTTCIYSLIHYLEQAWGVHYPRGGTGALVTALGKLLEDSGVDVLLGEDVERVLIKNGRATGIALPNGRSLSASRVIANGDPTDVYRRLVPKHCRTHWTDARLDRLQLSMGLYVLYFGTTKTYPNVQHHTIVFGQRYRELLRSIFKGDELGEDISLYLHRPTATDPSLAPTGHDAFYALVPVPDLRSHSDWPNRRKALQKQVLRVLEDRLLPELRSHMDVCFDFTPAEFQREYRSTHGAGFSIAPLLRQSAYFRFHNRSEDIERLYLAGAGTHPGAGVPGVLSSAKVVERLLLADTTKSITDHAAIRPQHA